MAMPRLIKAFGTVLLKVAAFWILLVATYLALGRQFFPAVERYDVELATLLSDQLGVQVSIGSLAGLKAGRICNRAEFCHRRRHDPENDLRRVEIVFL
jgi:hypothetical protein